MKKEIMKIPREEVECLVDTLRFYASLDVEAFIPQCPGVIDSIIIKDKAEKTLKRWDEFNK